MNHRVAEDAEIWTLLESIADSQQSPMTRKEFIVVLEHWYQEFQSAKCSLGYAAEQLGWKVTNL